jgi:hypothetical protein
MFLVPGNAFTAFDDRLNETFVAHFFGFDSALMRRSHLSLFGHSPTGEINSILFASSTLPLSHYHLVILNETPS